MSGAPDFTRLVTPTMVDQLLALTLENFTVAGTVVDLPPAEHQYVGLKVICAGAGLPGFTDLAVGVTNDTTSESCQPQSFLLGGNGGPRDIAVLYMPVGADTGDSLEIQLKSLTGADVNGKVVVGVWGLGQFPSNAPRLRPDGRLPAVGYRAANILVNGPGTGNLIAAPPAGVAIMLRRVSLQNNTAGGLDSNITASVNGTQQPVALIQSNESSSLELGDGLLCDYAKAVQAGVDVASGLRAAAWYDLVL